jgi:hypothetical protein
MGALSGPQCSYQLDFVETLPTEKAARNASPLRWLDDSLSGPRDTSLRAGTSTART